MTAADATGRAAPPAQAVTLRAWAERLLLGDALEDKLAGLAPDAADDAPGPALGAAPAAPGRPPALRLDRAPDERLAPPREGRLAAARDRGLLLHAFANHELLAIELFALGLLRFPDAPPAWRRGVAATIQEEQAHLRAYLARLEALGVGFGEAAPSAFFWTCLAPVRAPLELVAGLSLTFEQANLDFAAHWARALRRAGDEASAALLDRVLADEVGHVRHGAQWLERWRAPAQSAWEAWVAALRPPLTPRRARGRGPLLEDARRAAGLDADFVRRLRLEGQSTGRPPVVFAFRPTVEDEHARGRPGHVPRAPVRALARDQAALPAFLARPGDVVLVPARPSAAWLEDLVAAGVAPPELVVVDPDLRGAAAALAGRPLSGVRPWGWGPDAARALGPLAARVRPGSEAWAAWVPGPDEVAALRPLFSKAWGAARLAEALADDPALAALAGGPGVVGRACATESEVQAALEAVHAGGARAVVKAAFGCSGRAALRADGPLDAGQAGFVRRALAAHGAVVVEPWLDRTADLSVQLLVRGPDDVRVLGTTRFLACARGQYVGHVVGPATAGLDAPTRRLLAAGLGPPGPGGLEALDAVARRVGRALAAAGLRGHAGVDALVHRVAAAGPGDAGLRLKPLVEVNPRPTMGLVALELAGRVVRPGAVGLWRHVAAAEAARAGHASLADLAARARAALGPLAAGARRGVLCTNDPATATAVLGLLVVDADLAACGATLAALGLGPSP